jgi:ribonuclease HI
MIDIYTDGSAAPNPGPGGYGIVVEENGQIIKLMNGKKSQTTNNEQELTAIVKAIEWMQEFYPSTAYHIYSDSAYCVNLINQWMAGWAQKGWTRGKGEPVKNLELVKRLYEFKTSIPCNWEISHIKGHNNFYQNELADALATGNKEKISELYMTNPTKFEKVDFTRNL